MKFGASLNYLATWLGMLAAGTWTLPVFTLSVAPRTAEAVPMTSGSDDDGWTGSEVANAWALATGSAYTPASQVLTLQSGADHSPVLVDRVSVDDGTSLGLSWFMVDRSLPIAETTDETDEVSVVARAELVTGRVVGAAGHPGHFSGIRFAMSAEVAFGAGASQPSEQFALLPFAAFQAEADAIAFHESMVEASQGEGEGGGGEGGGIFCVNPNWRGFNGIECCMYESAFNDRVKACKFIYWGAVVACVVAALGTAVGVAKWALGRCAGICGDPGTVALCELCFKLSIVAVVGTALFLISACILGAELYYRGCIADARATYTTDLANGGCPPKPNAPPATLSTGDIDKKADLAD